MPDLDVQAIERLEKALRELVDRDVTIFDRAEADRLKVVAGIDPERLRKLAEISGEDVEHLHRVVKFLKGWDAIGALGGFLKMIVIWIGIIAGGIAAFRLGLAEWLAGVKP